MPRRLTVLAAKAALVAGLVLAAGAALRVDRPAARYRRDSAAASRISRTASGTPPSQPGPCPGSSQVASTFSIRSSDATACSGSSVNGAG